MTYDKKLDQSLKNLNKDIHWKENRQHHIRTKLINKMRQDKISRISKIRRKIVPVFSILLTIAIFTIIVLSEFSAPDLSTQHHNLKRTASGNDNNQTQLVAKNDESDMKETEREHKDNAENDGLQNGASDETDSQNRLLTQTEIMTAIKGQMASDLPLKLPEKVSLPEGKHLTAVTSSEKNNYEVIFYQHDEPIPINNKLLFSDENPAEVIARVHVKKYDTQDQADDAVSYNVFDESMGKPIKLREALTGYQNTSTESVSTNWNVGRWALTTHARSDDSERDVLLAKEVIAYLEVHMLPAPRKNGYAHLDAEYRENKVIWEEETTVYTIDQINDPLKALEMAINFE